ncbi:hypothetical protein [Acidovorax sp. BL-A-41-H1]|uniref:hypothetical protein n=1 Tax=Acidovorax sp. BL-A-41-H1 TaxID=3421102 RepID=UPI003F797D75
MKNFIIYAPSYDSSSGGTIVLHKLCDELNRGNANCKIYPLQHYKIQKNPLEIAKSLIRTTVLKILKISFKTNSHFETPVVTDFDRENTVVIYPEIVKNNPLGAKHIVRWLLFKDNWFSDHPEKYQDNLFFFYQEAFRPIENNIHCAGELQITHLQTEIYFNRGNQKRQGTCHAIRKGRKFGKILAPRSLLIDKLSHEEIASVFNNCERFISYDPYTLYSQYAAICGCLSIVEPIENLTKEQWQPIEGLRYGVAYGNEDIHWAINSREKVLPYLKSKEEENKESVKRFIFECEKFFKIQNEFL